MLVGRCIQPYLSTALLIGDDHPAEAHHRGTRQIYDDLRHLASLRLIVLRGGRLQISILLLRQLLVGVTVASMASQPYLPSSSLGPRLVSPTGP